jgi:hypothetical protein
LGIDVLGRHGAKAEEHLNIPSFRTGSRMGCIAAQNVTLLLSEA